MNGEVDLKTLWQQQPVAPPDIKALQTGVRKLKQAHRRRLLRTNLLLAGTCLLIIYIWIQYQPQFLTTKAGIILMITAMACYMIVSSRLLPLIRKTETTLPAADYLQELVTLKEKQRYLHTTVLNLYFLLLSAGLALYLIEPVSSMSTRGILFSYAITFAWVIFNWVYIRPRTIRKQQTRLDDLLSQLRKMQEQTEG